MRKILFVIKAGMINAILEESIYMEIPEDRDEILWLPISIWHGHHVRLHDMRVESIMDLKPKRYIYIKSHWDNFKDLIKQD